MYAPSGTAARSPALPPDPRITLSPKNPRAAVLDGQKYSLIDISADFMDAAPANVSAFSAEAFSSDLRRLNPAASSRSPYRSRFPRLWAAHAGTVRAALALDGVGDPDAYVMVYRSAWNARILVTLTPSRRANRRPRKMVQRPLLRCFIL